MQDLIKRYFWVLGGLVVMACAVFAAKATSHIVEAKYLGDSEHGPKIAMVAPRPETPVTPAHTKEGGPLAARNMFCSDCTPAVDTKSSDPSQIAITSLPLALLATNIGPRPEESYATIINSENQKQGAYAVGEAVPGAANSGKIKAIHFKYIDFENNGHLERLVLLGATPPATAVATVETPAVPSDENRDDMQASIDSGIKKIDDANYEIDKSLVEKVLLNPMAVAKGARVVPSMKNGKPDGFKLYAIRPSSAFAKLGLSNGDTLQSINGFELTSADKALEVYTKLREATSLEVEVTRRGKPVTLKYSIK
ncbi:MAG TPA: type II secretion system protein GspC [Kofleriaceae bacterium]|jgi:general secretion pathway protein C|nr:type II secretion system protein GspC [Kofleriaceae bacterium]